MGDEVQKAECVELGFLEKAESLKLSSKYFPSKVGGFPAWLGLDSLPNSICCKRCNKPLIFLCQLYAPYTSKEDCFHRTVFVFICQDGKCSFENDASNIRVLRCHLSRSNQFYSFDPPKEDEELESVPNASDYLKICRVCGCNGPKVCGACKKVTYCSKEHQALDWKSGHNNECKSQDEIKRDSGACKSLLFPEYEIDLEPEELDNIEEKPDEEVLEDYEKLLSTGQIPRDDPDDDDAQRKDLLRMAAKETDKQFARFRTRIKEYPNQVIRYDRGGEPLWVSSENKPQNILPCEHCGKPRQFEFQIMPQLLVHLKVDKSGPSLDWGTIVIYSCSDSCSQENTYIEEVAYKQDYSPSLDFLRQ